MSDWKLSFRFRRNVSAANQTNKHPKKQTNTQHPKKHTNKHPNKQTNKPAT